LSGAEVKYKIDFGNKGLTGATTPYLSDFWSPILRCDAPTYTSVIWNNRTTLVLKSQVRASD
jgi:hypothetical protein